jgi:hypothetical protein
MLLLADLRTAVTVAWDGAGVGAVIGVGAVTGVLAVRAGACT